MKNKHLDDPWVLGVSVSHNGAACLLKGDEIVVAIQEERLTRQKRDRLFANESSLAIPYCLEFAGITAKDLDMVVINSQTKLKQKANDIYLNPDLRLSSHNIPVLKIPHHTAHAYSAFATSGFEESDILTIDGSGSHCEDLTEEERMLVGSQSSVWEHSSFYYGEGTRLTPVRKFASPETRIEALDRTWIPSLGKIFELISYASFGDPSCAGKVMGLAAYGNANIPVELFLAVEDGELTLSDEFTRFFPSSPWQAKSRQAQLHADLAASAQNALEYAVLELLKHWRQLSKSASLCYAGGVALNSILNERIIRESGYENVYIMPASEDNGVAIGAAYCGLWQLTNKNNRKRLKLEGLGRPYSDREIQTAINQKAGVLVARDTGVKDVALRLAEGQVGAWFSGRSEFGPRALGNRSILCSPSSPDAKDYINEKVKQRELFRPFAPSILVEHVDEWFETDGYNLSSPFMLRVMGIRPEKANQVPAVLHVDNTARIQTVSSDNGPYYTLIKHFYEMTGVPMILNTSFNIMGEPIVERPEEALWSLLETPLEFCAFEGKIVSCRPGVSFLDLVPVISPFSYTFKTSQGDKGWEKPDFGDFIDVYPEQVLGKKKRRIGYYYLSQLEHIDGKKSNADILFHLKMDPSNQDHLKWWCTNIRHLLRAGLIELVQL